MDNGDVYNPTTEDVPASAIVPGRSSCSFSLARPSRLRAPVKLAELVLSLVAFICEEVVSRCTRCGGLYFFEFVSCSAFLLSLLVVIVYCTSLYDRVDQNKVKKSDVYITAITGLMFLIASITFACTSDGTSPETAAVVFGFLASTVFLIDFGLLKFENARKSQTRKPEVPQTTLTQPLNG
ncbi:CKLF-like MARVEL transmembrane domain-containing protein 6 [Phascolarctos cinereus]|uniref:CKLF-like MARVEL transmembrane domain-containing protein 6 n=1 Tax=Phascolarctos cinereus TaxID=38626 RepID=A0A6P5KZW5_PHACI|nr:CKLF-like MARVEL transmembrane domain-containing protein 6 [Phascolarctos cinereus]